MRITNPEKGIIRVELSSNEEQNFLPMAYVFILKNWKRQVMHLRKPSGNTIDLEYTSAKQFLGPGFIDQMATGTRNFEDEDIVEWIDIYFENYQEPVLDGGTYDWPQGF